MISKVCCKGMPQLTCGTLFCLSQVCFYYSPQNSFFTVVLYYGGVNLPVFQLPRAVEKHPIISAFPCLLLHWGYAFLNHHIFKHGPSSSGFFTGYLPFSYCIFCLSHYFEWFAFLADHHAYLRLRIVFFALRIPVWSQNTQQYLLRHHPPRWVIWPLALFRGELSLFPFPWSRGFQAVKLVEIFTDGAPEYYWHSAYIRLLQLNGNRLGVFFLGHYLGNWYFGWFAPRCRIKYLKTGFEAGDLFVAIDGTGEYFLSSFFFMGKPSQERTTSGPDFQAPVDLST